LRCGSRGAFHGVVYAEADVVGESYIETAGAAGEDVDVEVIFPLRHDRRITEESAVGKADSSASLRNDKQKASAEARTTATATAKADSSAALRNDKQRGKCKGEDNCNGNSTRRVRV